MDSFNLKQPKIKNTDNKDEEEDPVENPMIGLECIFQEPESFRPPSPEPKVLKHQTISGNILNIRLVGGHPLWGHVLYPASIVLSNYVEKNLNLINLNILELGAGGGLPGLVCALSGAKLVVSTDFPDPDLIKNLEWNADHNLSETMRGRLKVEGLKWGSTDLSSIFRYIHDQPMKKLELNHQKVRIGFDVIILSDLVFNHSEHASLLSTCESCLRHIKSQSSDEPFMLNIVEDRSAGVAFPLDNGDPEVRGTVHGWKMTLTECHE
ncbi:hypothetical protein PPACK8108_LOCUS14309 [Phakopsora pachyrhizi]|uniref:Nicotinamide N-methyltransferase n=1 Tax=Phakopsora pachyrhizi TaxID=170000 RepID=A0AAV0B700_PHAPC|nr:hypothetical protein PPACK8108_LOCUS14309 [Phakopsora pachyrhizi]